METGQVVNGLWPCTLQAHRVKPGVFQKPTYF